MRRLAIFAALVFAAPAFAQTPQEQAAEIMVTNTVAEGFSQDLSEQIAECFVSRMTDAEAEAFVAAEDLEAQQDAAAAMTDYAQAVLCVAEAME